MKVTVQSQCSVRPQCQQPNLPHVVFETQYSAVRITVERLDKIIKDHKFNGTFSLVVTGVRDGTGEPVEMELRSPLKYKKFVEGVHAIDVKFTDDAKEASICGKFGEMPLVRTRYTGDYMRSNSSASSIDDEIATLERRFSSSLSDRSE